MLLGRNLDRREALTIAETAELRELRIRLEAETRKGARRLVQYECAVGKDLVADLIVHELLGRQSFPIIANNHDVTTRVEAGEPEVVRARLGGEDPILSAHGRIKRDVDAAELHPRGFIVRERGVRE